jgi:hypothetical protein
MLGLAPRPVLLTLGVAAFLVAACSPDQSERAATAHVRDSAGIRIVENPTSGAEGERWWLGDGPVVDIGRVGGADTSTLLYQVEGATRLSDGRLVVANRSSNELRYYDARGQHLFSAVNTFSQRGGREKGPASSGISLGWEGAVGTRCSCGTSRRTAAQFLTKVGSSYEPSRCAYPSTAHRTQ